MKRTILMSLVVIGAVVALIVGASLAVFNDSEQADPVTLAAGILDLELDETEVVSEGLSDLKPSVWHYLGPYWVHNAGTNPGVLDLHFANVVDSGGVLSEPEEEAEYAGPIDDISNWIDVDRWIVGPFTEIDEAVVCQSGAGLGRLGDIESRTFDLGTMQPSEWYAVCISFHLALGAGNEYQGDTSTFDIEFTLHQTTQPAGVTSVRLENKDTVTWQPILGDDLYGSVTYEVDGNGDLSMALEARGLQPGKWYQIGMTGPDSCSDTDDQLASGVQQYADFDSHFWVGGAPSSTCTPPTAGYGFYNFAYEQANAAGEINQTYTIGNAGVADPDGSTDVSGAHPALPSGVYTGVKFLVKYYEPNQPTPPWPGTYTSVLMEMQTLNFNLP